MGGTEFKQVSSKKRQTRKRSFKGNRYSSSVDVDVMNDDQQTEQEGENTNVVPSNDEQSVSAPSISSSASKIDLSFYDSMEGDTVDVPGPSQIHKTSSNINTNNMYMLTDVKIFMDLLKLIGRCPDCCSTIDNTVDFSSKKGLAQKVMVSCSYVKDCGWSYSTYLSTKLTTDERSRYDVNVRSIIAFREIGRGLGHIETFNRVMNMPPPYTHSTYDEMVNDILPGYVAAICADITRIAAINYKSTDRVQSRRKKLHAKKKGYTDLNDKDYGAGMH
jgi:hypothetical protein